MKINRKQIATSFCFAFCLLIIIMMIPCTCFSKVKKSKTVRLAYEIEPGYQEGGAGEYKTGFGNEYLRKLAKINWIDEDNNSHIYLCRAAYEGRVGISEIMLVAFADMSVPEYFE